MAFPLPALAYDLAMLTRPFDRLGGDSGWVFGLPPGLSPRQWPLDPVTGYPLMHGFTLLLPPDYRAHGPEIVALSFFATAADQNDGGAVVDPELRSAVLGESHEPPRADLLPFWEVARAAHPRLHRMTDILDYEYALILLTQAEFDGPLCPPPHLSNSAPYSAPAPQWLENGAAYAFYEQNSGDYLRRLLGEAPVASLDENRAIQWSPRESDPNAGKAPQEDYSSAGAPSGYRPYFYWEGGVVAQGAYREHEWAKGHAQNHIGGTMRPSQAIPSMSPFYVEFEEYFGGYNFGGGNAQLDFKDMSFDWACG